MEFDYNSHSLFRKLKDRGKVLSNGKDCSDINQNIEKFLSKKKRRFTTPKTAIVTFEYPQAVNMIMAMKKQEKLSKRCCCPFSSVVSKPDGKIRLAPSQALLPWNIKWESRY